MTIGIPKETKEFATSPVMIRVIEASNTADWINLGIIKAVESRIRDVPKSGCFNIK